MGQKITKLILTIPASAGIAGIIYVAIRLMAG
jgi:hypothetical protein